MIRERSARFLMANLGSEVSRIFSARQKGDMEMAEKCLVRAKRILAQLTSSPEMKERDNELLLLGDVIDDILRPARKYSVSELELKEYFYPFASRIVA